MCACMHASAYSCAVFCAYVCAVFDMQSVSLASIHGLSFMLLLLFCSLVVAAVACWSFWYLFRKCRMFVVVMFLPLHRQHPHTRAHAHTNLFCVCASFLQLPSMTPPMTSPMTPPALARKWRSATPSTIPIPPVPWGVLAVIARRGVFVTLETPPSAVGASVKSTRTMPMRMVPCQ